MFLLVIKPFVALQSRPIKLQNKVRDRAQQPEVPNEEAFFTQGTPSDACHFRFSPTVEQDCAEKLAQYNRHARSYQCGKLGHFIMKTVLTTLTVLPLVIHRNPSALRVLLGVINTSNHVRAKRVMGMWRPSLSNRPPLNPLLSSEVYRRVVFSSQDSSSFDAESFWFADSDAT